MLLVAAAALAVTLSADPPDCLAGETIDLTIEDPESGWTYHWTDNSEREDRFEDPDALETSWTCPEVPAGEVKSFSVFVEATDPRGVSDFSFLKIDVAGPSETTGGLETDRGGGCATAAGAASLLLSALAAGLVRRR